MDKYAILSAFFNTSKSHISEDIANIYGSRGLAKTQLFGISEQFKWKDQGVTRNTLPDLTLIHQECISQVLAWQTSP